MAPKKRAVSVSLPVGLVDWLDQYAKANDWHRQSEGTRGGLKRGRAGVSGRSSLIQYLLQALRDGRVEILPEADAFPAELHWEPDCLEKEKEVVPNAFPAEGD